MSAATPATPMPGTAAAAAAALNSMPVPGNLDTLIAGAQPLGLGGSGRPPLPPGSTPTAAAAVAAAACDKSGPAKTPTGQSAALAAPNSTSRPLPQLREVVRQVRRELNSIEEEVPWTAVDVSKWRAARKSWQKRLRAAEQLQDVATCMFELHDALLTDKTMGVFMEGGPWELALLDCANGSGNHIQLQHCWTEMRACLQHWLAERQLGPGGNSYIDRPSYEAAMRAYHVLQGAASKGCEALDQVPLECLLANPMQMSVLQAILAKEVAHTHARLQALAAGSSLHNVGSEGALSDGILSAAKSGHLPGLDSDGEGSDATDLGDW